MYLYMYSSYYRHFYPGKTTHFINVKPKKNSTNQCNFLSETESIYSKVFNFCLYILFFLIKTESTINYIITILFTQKYV